MLTTAGITFATARTTGSEAGSVGVDDGNGVGVCANNDWAARKRMIAVADPWTQVPLRALHKSFAFDIVLYCIPSGGVKSPAQVTGRALHCQLAGRLVFTTLS
jgi:hypothetical protein